MDGSNKGTGGKAERGTANRGDAGAAPSSLQITYRPIGDLIPFARNARTHSEAQVALIAGSIREYGFTNPVLVDGANGIIAGHGRVLAARKLGLAAVPTIELAHLTEVQKRAYVLADNRLAEAAGWDRELLGLELGDLADRLAEALAGGPAPVGPLSPRELDVLAQIALGCTNTEAAQRLSLKPETVKSYLRSAATKLGTHTRHEAVSKARQLRLIP